MILHYIGTIGTTSVAFSAGRVLFNTLTVEFVSLIVVIGRSEIVGVCAYVGLVVVPIKVIVVKMTTIYGFMIFMIY